MQSNMNSENKYYLERSKMVKLCKEYNDQEKEDGVCGYLKYFVGPNCNCLLVIDMMHGPYHTFCDKKSEFCDENHNEFY